MSYPTLVSTSKFLDCVSASYQFGVTAVVGISVLTSLHEVQLAGLLLDHSVSPGLPQPFGQTCVFSRLSSACLPLRKDTAAELQAFVAGKMPSVAVFDYIPKDTSKMLQADLKAADISYVDDAGRYVDFHSLRHTTGSLLAASGVHPKVAQQIMRHGDINLTMSRYTHVFSGQESEAIARLPDLSAPSSGKQRATGTDPKSVLAENLALPHAQLCLPPAQQCAKNTSENPKPAIETKQGESESAKNCCTIRRLSPFYLWYLFLRPPAVRRRPLPELRL